MESKWVGEIAENCQGVKLVLVALKCDLREKHSDEDDEAAGESDAGHPRREKEMIDYKQGLEVARRIQALRYLGMVEGCLSRIGSMLKLMIECSAKRNRGVNEAFTEAARVALSVKSSATSGGGSKCSVM